MTLKRTHPLVVPPAGPAPLAALGLGWLVIAAAASYLALATPAVARLVGSSRDAAEQAPLGGLCFALAIVVPVLLAVAGTARLSAAVHLVRAIPRVGPARRVAARLDPEAIVIGPVRLNDGGSIPEVVVGRHGIVVFRELAPIRDARLSVAGWEARIGDVWLPCENPLERTARDGDRLRQRLNWEDRDFVVRVHAAVVPRDGHVDRIPSCAVVATDDIPAFLAALPAQRTLTPDRIASIARQLAGGI